jgi:hypothetical protein
MDRLKNMKKHELLKFAYDNYPKGIEVHFHGKEATFELNGNYSFDEEGDIIDSTKRGVYLADKDKWATIVNHEKPKEIVLEIGCVKCTVTNNGISFDGSVQFLMADSIEKINEAIKQLK